MKLNEYRRVVKGREKIQTIVMEKNKQNKEENRNRKIRKIE